MAMRCPTDAELSAFLGGWATDEQTAALGDHLEACPTCRTRIADTAPSRDTLLGAVTRPATAPRFADELGARYAVRLAVDLAPSAGDQITPSGHDAPSINTEGLQFPRFSPPPEGSDALGQLGPYLVVKPLGTGGMGFVFEACDPQLERRVAVKVLKPQLASDPAARRRFLREARSAAQVRHPHVVAVHHVGEDRGCPYLVMEYLEGESLSKRLRRTPQLPVAEAVEIGVQLASGLAAAHAQNLIHRDVKPENIWLSAGDRLHAVLLDFGLARTVQPDAGMTQTGVIVGTPSYMAPEQANGRTAVDHRCDLFSLGCVLYRALTGRMPFPGADLMTTLMAIATHHPPPVAEVRPDVPAALSAAIDKLLAKDPGERCATAHEAAVMLRGTRALPPRPRRRFRIALAAVALAVIGIVGLTQLKRDPVPSPAVPEQSPAGFRIDAKTAVSVATLSFAGRSLLTVEMWVTPLRFENKQSQHLLGVPRQGSFFVQPGGRLWGFGVRVGNNNLFTTTTAPPAIGDRVHLAAVLDHPSQLSLYQNGKLVNDTVPIYPPVDSNANTFAIGPGFDGLLADVRVSMTARYQQDFVPPVRCALDGDTLALFHGDLTADGRLRDASPNEHHGTITTAATPGPPASGR